MYRVISSPRFFVIKILMRLHQNMHPEHSIRISKKSIIDLQLQNIDILPR